MGQILNEYYPLIVASALPPSWRKKIITLRKSIQAWLECFIHFCGKDLIVMYNNILLFLHSIRDKTMNFGIMETMVQILDPYFLTI